MNTFIKRKGSSFAYRVFSAFIALTFVFSSIIPPQRAHAQSVLNLHQPGVMIPLSSAFSPAIMKGVRIFPDNPLRFDFVMEKGDMDLEGEELKKEYTKIIKYFLASLTVPEENLWVNLSPYEENRIIPEDFGQTEMGRDLLAQDYILKQITASLIYPEDDLGKKFWSRVYEKANALYGTSEIPVNTFNKVWIIPEKATVYVNGDTVYITDSYLKVMLEEDYVALEHNSFKPETDIEELSDISSAIIRDVVIPELEKEVNTGKNFANLRQIYNAVIFATWFKQNLKESFLGQVYVDQKKVSGIDVEDKTINKKIYNKYLEAFNKGVFDFVKEDYDLKTQEVIPRKYFSGGAALNRTKVSEGGSLALLGDEDVASVNLMPKRNPPPGSPYRVFLEVKEKRNPTAQEIADSLGRSFNTIKTDLSAMVERNILIRDGDSKSPDAKYSLTESADRSSAKVEELLQTIGSGRPVGVRWTEIDNELQVALTNSFDQSKLLVPANSDPINVEEYQEQKVAIYPGYFYNFDELGVDVIRESLKVYDKMVLLVLKQDERFADATLQKTVDRVNRIASKLLASEDFERIKVVGVSRREDIVPFLKAAKISGMVRKFHRVESEGKLEAESETSRINYEEYGLQTTFAIPAYNFLELPDDDESRVKDEAYRSAVTSMLKARFPDEPAYRETLTRDQFENLIDGTSIFEILGQESSEIDPNIAFYAGSFDPLTNGHLEALRQAANVYREIIVGIGVNPAKTPMFSAEERIELIEESLRSIGITNVRVVAYDAITPTVQVAGENGAGTLLRGARNVADIQDELVLAWINQMLNPNMRTVLVTPHEYEDVSSTKLRDEFAAGNDISELAPGPIYFELTNRRLRGVIGGTRIIGLVGGLASGKSIVLTELERNRNTETIDLDKVGHQVLEKPDVIERLSNKFGTGILTEGKIDRVKLRAVVFDNDRSRFVLNSIVRASIFSETERLIQEIKEAKPATNLIVLEGIGIVEAGMHRFMDEVWYVDTHEELRVERALADGSRVALDGDRVRGIIETQRPTLELSQAKADVVFDNSRDLEFLRNQVEKEIAIENVRPKWKQALGLVNAEDENSSVFNRIVKKYLETHRAYHNITHIDALFRIYDELVESGDLDELIEISGEDEIAALMFAIFLHDVIYNAIPGQDEDRSLEFAEEVLSELGVSREVIDRAKYLIELTKTHQVDPTDMIAKLFMDLDLTILGEEEEVFVRYDRSIRKEFKQFPFVAYVQGRKRILEGFERDPDLFGHPVIKAKYAERAKQNLRRVIDFLGRIDTDLVAELGADGIEGVVDGRELQEVRDDEVDDTLARLEESALSYLGGENIITIKEARQRRTKDTKVYLLENGKDVIISDSAMTSSSPIGGIDLNSNNFELLIQGDGLKFEIPLNFQGYENIQINGFTPVIFKITPIINFPLLIGEQHLQDEEKLSFVQ